MEVSDLHAALGQFIVSPACWGCLQSSGDDGETQQLERNALAVKNSRIIRYDSTYQLRNISCLLHQAKAHQTLMRNKMRIKKPFMGTHLMWCKVFVQILGPTKQKTTLHFSGQLTLWVDASFTPSNWHQTPAVAVLSLNLSTRLWVLIKPVCRFHLCPVCHHWGRFFLPVLTKYICTLMCACVIRRFKINLLLLIFAPAPIL